MDTRRSLTLVAVVIFTIHALHYWSIWIDDAFITFRYAHNFHAGLGMVYNEGERVEGITNLGWALLLSPFADSDALFAAKCFGLAFGVGTVVLLGEWMRAQELAVPAMGLGLAVVVLFPWMPSYAMYGLETDAAAFFVTLAWTRHGREADGKSWLPLSAIGMALAPWVRPDGALAAIVVGLWHFVRKGPKFSRALGIAVVLVLASAAALVELKLHWFGSIVPNTAITKLREWPPSRGYIYLHSFFGWPSPMLSGLCAAGVIWAVMRAVKRQDRALPGLFAIVAVAAAVAQNGDFMQNFRFFVPAWPAVAAAVAVLVNDLGRLHRFVPAGMAAAAVPAFSGVISVLQADRLMDSSFVTSVESKTQPFLWPWLERDNPTFFDHKFSYPAAWSVVHRSEADPIAYVNIGLLGWSAEGPLVDLLGLTDPIMANRYSADDLDAAWAHITRDVTFMMLDVPDGEWARYRKLLVQDKWVLYDGCPPYWIFANPTRLPDYHAPNNRQIEERLVEALARNPRNPTLLLAIARELAFFPGDVKVFNAWSAEIGRIVPSAQLMQVRCSAGFGDSCTWTPTCDSGRARLDLTEYPSADDWPTPTMPEPRKRATHRPGGVGAPSDPKP